MARRGWWRSAHWRKAPFVLLNHASALVAVAAAGFLVALASASAPFVTTAAASAALKDKLTDLSPLATGLEISGFTDGSESYARLIRDEDRREAAARSLTGSLRLEQPVFTLESANTVYISTPDGDAQVKLMARTGVLGHLKILSRTGGPGVWISDFTAGSARVKPGDAVTLDYSSASGRSQTVKFRIKGIYRALDRSAPGPFWANFIAEILPPGADPPPPARYVFLGRDELIRVATKLSSGRTVRYQGTTFRAGNPFDLLKIAELPVDPSGLTLSRARALVKQLDGINRQIGTSALGQRLGCAPPPGVRVGINRNLCKLSSSLSAAVALADSNVSEISPAITLLSGAGAAIALAVAAAAGVFLVRRRQAESALLYARGEHVATFAARTGLEVLLPVAVGGAAGFALALGLTGAFAPSGSIDGGTISSALAHGGVALGVALLLIVATAAGLFLKQFDSGARSMGWLRWAPWELPVLAVALWLLYDVHNGGGLASSGASGARHPTLAVFVFPLLLVAAVAGLLARGFRLLLRRRTDRGSGLPTALFLTLRRLTAARGVLVVLAVVSAVSFGAYFYAEALAASLTSTVAEKAYIARGGDVQGIVSQSSSVPKGFPYPATVLDYGNQSATLGTTDGAQADVMAIDPATLGTVIPWYSDWGPDPRGSLSESDGDPNGPLPVITTRDAPAGLHSIWIQSERFPVKVVARVTSFPGMSVGIPVVVVSKRALAAAAKRLDTIDPLGVPQTYVWVKGPPGRVARTIEAEPLQAFFVTTVDEFRKDPDVLLATRTFRFMRLIAIAAGLLVLVGLLLYLQARQRTQAIASALAARMGLRRRVEVLSLALELAAIALFAAVVGGVVAISAAGPVMGHIDPLPDDPPSTTLTIPVGAILVSAIALVVLAIGAAMLTSWLARRTDMSEALRVA